jgi:hypothetical protein
MSKKRSSSTPLSARDATPVHDGFPGGGAGALGASDEADLDATTPPRR